MLDVRDPLHDLHELQSVSHRRQGQADGGSIAAKLVFALILLLLLVAIVARLAVRP
jgi:hypothetical protein